MRVVIDISPLRTAHKGRGIGIYTKYLARALKNLNDKNEYILTGRPHGYEADVVHYPFFDFFSNTLPLRKKGKTVVTVHDTIPLVFPDEYRPGIKGQLRHRLQRISLKSVDRVICDSNNSKNDVYKYFGIPKQDIDVVYLAASEKFKPASQVEKKRVVKKYGLQQSYVLYVGDINYNKNVPALVRAFSSVQGAQLVLVTRAMKNLNIPESKRIHEEIERLGDSNKVKVLTDVPLEPEKDLVGLYSAAKIYVQPSLYEGFGLPVLEAMSCETPVICSKASSLPEVAGEAAIYFNPNKERSMVKGLKAGLKLSGKRRKSLIEKGNKQVKQFSWQKTAEETSKIYQLVHDA